VVLEGEGPPVRGAAHVAAELEVVVLLVGLYVGPGRVEGGERPRALGAPEGLRVAVLMAGELHPGLEGLRAVGARVGPLLAVRQQVVVVHGGGLEALAAVLALVRTHPRVRAHVEGQAVGDPELLAADLPSVRSLYHYFVRVGGHPQEYGFARGAQLSGITTARPFGLGSFFL
jgi:hypothetical protein